MNKSDRTMSLSFLTAAGPGHGGSIATVRLRDSAALQRFLYLFETPCKSPAEDAELGIVRVSQKPIEKPDIQRSVDVELGTALMSQQLC
ncbi:hypothetical protein TNCV_1708331 [Trichonephila clavipes]|nr:hypothetical protein TNCV_1708331 [Trichonephila clavipes]